MAYLDELPGFLRNIREYKALAEAFDPVLEDLKERITAFPLSVLPGTAEDDILRRWEKMTELSSIGTLEQRRFRLLSRLGSLRPYTVEQLRRQLASAFGKDDCFSVDVDGENFTLTVEVDSDSADVLAAMTEELRRMIPANLILHTQVGQSEQADLFIGAVMQVTAVHDLRS